jgi:hypothetical protein
VDGDTLVVDSTNHQVGIGKTNPDATLDVDGDAIIRGDLSVLGTTTTIDTENLRVQDPIIELGKDNAGTGDLGLIMTRPSGSSNVAVIFDENTDTLKIGYTNGGASDTTITMDSAPLSANVNGNLSVTSNLEVGTANLFVDTVNSRIGVNTSTPTESLDVVGNMNLQQVSNTSTIKANSNVVTEFPRSKKFMKFPRVALTSAAQTGSGYEGYFVSQDSATLNSTSNRQAWGFFNSVTNPNDASGGPHLIDATERFDNSGNYIGGDTFAGISGDWITIQLPVKIQLGRVHTWSRYVDQRNPVDATILGSLDGTNWTTIASWSGRDFTYNHPNPYDIQTNEYYNYFAFVFEKIEASSSGKYINFNEIELFGTPEYDPEADGVDVVVKSVPNVPNTDWLEVYYDAKNYSGSGDVQDETANDIDATIGAATTFDSVNKAWSFSGTSNRDGTEFVSGYLPSDFEGQQIHSVSMWLKFDYWHEGGFCIIGKETRTGSDSHKAIHFQFQDTNSGSPKILYDFWSNQKSFYLPDDVQPGKWLHMTATYSGDAANRKMFVNGQELTTFTTSSAYATELALDTTNDLVVRLGTRFPVNSLYIFHGDIANFRLFNRALTSDEIYQLYAYQKEYFGHGDLGMTLKAGRLGIGTSEPKAALDVRGIGQFGSIYAPGTIVQVQHNSGNSSLSYSSSAAANYNDIPLTSATGLKLSITPTKTTSKVHVNLNVLAYLSISNGSANGVRMQVWRRIGTTYNRVYGRGSATLHDLHWYRESIDNFPHVHISLSFVDSPSTVLACEYELRAMLYATPPQGTYLYIGNGGNQPATITLMEIGGE